MKGCSLPEQTTKKLLFLPGPEFDNEASGCQQFHFMPRFVRFLPGETLNNLQRTCPAFLAICLPLMLSADTVLHLKRATEQKKELHVSSDPVQTFLHMLLWIFVLCSRQNDPLTSST